MYSCNNVVYTNKIVKSILSQIDEEDPVRIYEVLEKACSDLGDPIPLPDLEAYIIKELKVKIKLPES